MRRIQRYRFEANLGERELQLPVGSEVLGAALYNGAPTIWVSVPGEDPPDRKDAATPAPPSLEVRRFLLTTTGFEFEEAGADFLGFSLTSGHEILIFELGSESVHALSARVDAVIAAHDERFKKIRAEFLQECERLRRFTESLLNEMRARSAE